MMGSKMTDSRMGIYWQEKASFYLNKRIPSPRRKSLEKELRVPSEGMN